MVADKVHEDPEAQPDGARRHEIATQMVDGSGLSHPGHGRARAKFQPLSEGHPGEHEEVGQVDEGKPSGPLMSDVEREYRQEDGIGNHPEDATEERSRRGHRLRCRQRREAPEEDLDEEQPKRMPYGIGSMTVASSWTREGPTSRLGLPAAAVGDEELQEELVLADGMDEGGTHGVVDSPLGTPREFVTEPTVSGGSAHGKGKLSCPLFDGCTFRELRIVRRPA